MENPSGRLKPRDNRSSDAVMYEATCIPLDDVFLSAIQGNKDRCMPGTPTTYVVKQMVSDHRGDRNEQAENLERGPRGR